MSSTTKGSGRGDAVAERVRQLEVQVGQLAKRQDVVEVTVQQVVEDNRGLRVLIGTVEQRLGDKIEEIRKNHSMRDTWFKVTFTSAAFVFFLILWLLR